MLTREDFLAGVKGEENIAKAIIDYNQYVARATEIERVTREIDAKLLEYGYQLALTDLVDLSGDPQALHVLLPWFRHQYFTNVIPRCFARPDAHEHWGFVRDEFFSVRDRKDSDPYKQSLAVVLGEMCSTQDELAELYEIIEDSRNGGVRTLMMHKVKRANIKLFEELFARLVDFDEQVREEILSWKSYWKKRNPALLEKWNGWRPPKKGSA